MAFSDDFNRADGPLGNGWIVTGTAVIEGNQAKLSNYGSAECPDTTSETDMDGSITVRVTGGVAATARLMLRMGGGNGSVFHFDCSVHNDAGWITVGYWNGTYDTYVAAGNAAHVGDTPCVFRAKVVGDDFTAYVDGTPVLTFTSGDAEGGDGLGIGGSATNSYIDAFQSGEPAPPMSMEISPDPVWVGGGPVGMTATGTNTTWTVGVPGSSEITVDHGEISDQWTESATVIRFTWTPAEYVGPIEFTESEFGLTDTINSTVSEPEGGNPCPCPFDAAFIATANATVQASNRGFPTLQTIMVPASQGWGDLYLQELLVDLWYSHFRPESLSGPGSNPTLDILWTLLNGRYPAPAGPFLAPTFDTVDAGLTQIWTIVNTMSQGNTLTLQSILDALGGGGATIQDVLDAIGTSWFDPDYTLHDDLDYLDNRSDHSLDQIQTRLGNIWGTDHWSLSQIVGAASDPQIESFASLHNIYSRLQAMRGDSTSTIANAEDWANLANTNAAAAHSAIDHMATVDQHTLQDVLDAIAGISIPEPAPGYQGAPVWPGVGNATVYQPYNLADGLTVQGPLHGLLFAITGQPAGAGRYRFGPHNSWTKTGAVIFTSDRGDHERAQQFGLDAHVICPKEMRIASSATLRLNTGWTGTVRRFLID